MEQKLPLYIIEKYCVEYITDDIFDYHLKKNLSDKDYYKNWYTRSEAIEDYYIVNTVDIYNILNNSLITKEYILSNVNLIGLDKILLFYFKLTIDEKKKLLFDNDLNSFDTMLIEKIIKLLSLNEKEINKLNFDSYKYLSYLFHADKYSCSLKNYSVGEKIMAYNIIQKHKLGEIIDSKKFIECIKILKN